MMTTNSVSKAYGQVLTGTIDDDDENSKVGLNYNMCT